MKKHKDEEEKTSKWDWFEIIADIFEAIVDIIADIVD